VPPADLPLRLIFNNIANVPPEISDPSDVDDRNTFFNLPANGTPFASVEVVGAEVKLYGGSGITIFAGLFNGASLVSIIDEALCIVECEAYSLQGNVLMTTITLNAVIPLRLQYC